MLLTSSRISFCTSKKIVWDMFWTILLSAPHQKNLGDVFGQTQVGQPISRLSGFEIITAARIENHSSKIRLNGGEARVFAF
jgi:hypothetical protein